MNDQIVSRRLALKKLVAMSAIGVVGTFWSGSGISKVSRQSIPGISGKIIYKEDENYELWRQSMVWHLSKPKRYPDVIVKPRSVEEVISAVKHAATNSLKVAIRSGGHNSTGSSLRNGGMLLDLSGMSELEIDEHKQVASVQPGVRSDQLVRAAREKSLSFPVPHCTSVGISGFVMGGGIGWNYPQNEGMATFSIVGAEVITADGQRIMATEEQHSDLLWAVRGAGPGFFGVVTRLFLKLYPAPKSITASSYIFPLQELQNVTSILDQINKDKTVRERIELLTVLMHHPEMPVDAPPEKSKICFVTAFAFEQSATEGRVLLEPFSKSDLSTKSLVKDEFQSFTFEGLYDKFFSLEDPAGRMARYSADNVLTNKGSDALIAMAEHLKKAPSTDTHVLTAWGLNLQPREDACFSGVGDCFVGCYSIWDGEENDQANRNWLKQSQPIIDQFAYGHYVNEINGVGNPNRYRECYSKSKWKRLNQLRDKYDPVGVFHSFLGHS
ncbi:FAD-binding oxidoreductase [Candidatus Thiodiazotropha sp. LNASS1]|uniref:FAD-binding oxidoreductase n=1 Tax=Candidatus Thiodiazotropha sp. LNASS1 TaxID=3096260 RepID=UPI0034E0210C